MLFGINITLVGGFIINAGDGLGSIVLLLGLILSIIGLLKDN
ncbi:hypothetical protein [Niallia sp. 03133]